MAQGKLLNNRLVLFDSVVKNVHTPAARLRLTGWDCFSTAATPMAYRLQPIACYMFLMISSPNSEHFSSVAPSINRAKS